MKHMHDTLFDYLVIYVAVVYAALKLTFSFARSHLGNVITYVIICMNDYSYYIMIIIPRVMNLYYQYRNDSRIKNNIIEITRPLPTTTRRRVIIHRHEATICGDAAANLPDDSRGKRTCRVRLIPLRARSSARLSPDESRERKTRDGRARRTVVRFNFRRVASRRRRARRRSRTLVISLQYSAESSPKHLISTVDNYGRDR